MNEEQARAIIGEQYIKGSGELYDVGAYRVPTRQCREIYWSPKSPDSVVLDGEFDLEVLRAILWWMDNKRPKQST